MQTHMRHCHSIIRDSVEGEEQLQLTEEIKRIFQTRTQNEWNDLLRNADACCEPVLNFEEVFDHPHVLYRQMVKELEYPVEGKIRQIGNPIKSSGFSFEVHYPPPSLGEHTEEVLRSIGYADEKIRHFREIKAI